MQITVNGLSIHYTLEGPPSGPVITMSHSLAANLSMWDPQLPALSSRYRVLRYDTRGHGGTEVSEEPYSLDRLVEDARALLQALGITRTHFIGLSMGGMVAQILALRAPELLESLVLCDTTSRVPPEAKPTWDERIGTAQRDGMAPLVEPTIGRWFTAGFSERRPEVVARVREMIRATDPRGYIGCCHAIAPLNLTDRISAITLPTLIIVGEEDPATPVAAAETIQGQINGSELVVLPSASHLSNLEQPEAFNEAVTRFLGKRA